MAAIYAVTVLAVIVIVVWTLWLRHRRHELQHRERMAALEKGMPIPASPIAEARPIARTYLLRGLTWLFSGAGVAVFLLGITISTHRPTELSTRLWQAADARRNGATEAQVQALLSEQSYEGLPAGLALIGVIPMAFGLAYLIAYRVETGGKADSSSEASEKTLPGI